MRAAHWAAVPVIAPGVAGAAITVTARVWGVLVPQVFPAVTVILPFCPAAPVVTVIELVPAPPVIVHPVGTVHVYVVAPGTAVTLGMRVAELLSDVDKQS